jgi:two-component system, chemotaxis family, protein-glutamate methylesterase/glutaminase
MIKIVIVDDSRTARMAMRQALETDPDILVVGEAATGDEALSLMSKYNPDLVTMDVYLEDENGLDVAASIMAENPRPIVAITGINPSNPRLVYQALERGVLEVFPKLPSMGSRHYNKQRTALVRLIKTLAEVPVLHLAGRKIKKIKERQTGQSVSPSTMTDTRSPRRSRSKILLIGASTGGPPVVCSVLQALPKDFALPIVVVQHISEGFGSGFATWLGQMIKRPTLLVEHAIEPKTNTVYVAPDSKSIKFTSSNHLSPTAPIPADLIQPSINRLFVSGAKYFGSSAIAVLLTGMGRDGAVGMKSLYDEGAYTIAQSLDTCAVDSMPKNAIALEAVDAVLAPSEIAQAITRKVGW